MANGLQEDDRVEQTCRSCGAKYPLAGDGWDGECPECADKTYAREFDEDGKPRTCSVVTSLKPAWWTRPDLDYPRCQEPVVGERAGFPMCEHHMEVFDPEGPPCPKCGEKGSLLEGGDPHLCACGWDGECPRCGRFDYWDETGLVCQCAHEELQQYEMNFSAYFLGNSKEEAERKLSRLQEAAEEILCGDQTEQHQECARPWTSGGNVSPAPG